jgi:hypothetical protein
MSPAEAKIEAKRDKKSKDANLISLKICLAYHLLVVILPNSLTSSANLSYYSLYCSQISSGHDKKDNVHNYLGSYAPIKY